jgi:beta-lactamase regulating signal transducer with metallopeptidase domain
MSLALVVGALARTLLHFVWQGTLLAGAYAAARLVLRGASPESRYAGACTAMAAMVAWPVVTFALACRDIASRAGGAMATLSHTEAQSSFAIAVPSLVSAAWALGALLMLVRVAGGAHRVRLLRASGVPLPDDLRHRAERIAEKLGIRRPFALLQSPLAPVPLVLGWLRPAILLPLVAVSGLSPLALEAIVAHELAHVRRHDVLVNAMQSAVEALLFYHPGMWWVSRELRREREHCCDDAAVLVVGDALAYARALALVESIRIEGPAAGVAATGGSLMERIDRLVNRVSEQPRAPRAGFAQTVAGALTVVACVACASLLVAACTSAQNEKTRARPTAANVTDVSTWLPATVTRWMPTFVDAGARHGVDPNLLAIVTMLESRGDPDAKSPTGAVGLMQIMPATGTRIAAERGLAEVDVDTLRDPKVNVDFGAWYLAAQLKTFGTPNDPERSVELAAAAYNGGPACVRAYLEQGTPLPEETAGYKDRVLAMWKEHPRL